LGCCSQAPGNWGGCRIWGIAEILSCGGLFVQINPELSSRNMQARNIVVVSVNEFMVF
jgi:hypothetical protein